MKVKFIGLMGKRQHHQDFALELVTETEFEQSFLGALLDSREGSRQPIATLLCRTEQGISIMIDSEKFEDSQLSKERVEHMKEIETIKGKPNES